MDRKAVQGLAALMWMVECIGSEHETDHSIAEILTANELELRALIKAVTQQLAMDAPARPVEAPLHITEAFFRASAHLIDALTAADAARLSRAHYTPLSEEDMQS